MEDVIQLTLAKKNCTCLTPNQKYYSNYYFPNSVKSLCRTHVCLIAIDSKGSCHNYIGSTISKISWFVYILLIEIIIKINLHHHYKRVRPAHTLACNTCLWCGVVAERSSALDASSGVVRMWVRIPDWPVAALVSLSKTLNHNCFALRMGRKAVGPVCCVMHVKEPRTLIVKEKGLAPVFLDSRLEHPAGWICARYKSSVLIFCIIIFVSEYSLYYLENFSIMSICRGFILLA